MYFNIVSTDGGVESSKRPDRTSTNDHNLLWHGGRKIIVKHVPRFIRWCVEGSCTVRVGQGQSGLENCVLNPTDPAAKCCQRSRIIYMDREKK
jgi:hypothetical protein